jgi:hypothetical protein
VHQVGSIYKIVQRCTVNKTKKSASVSIKSVICTSSYQVKRQPHCYRGADKSLAQPTSRFILYDGENISFDASLVIYIYK